MQRRGERHPFGAVNVTIERGRTTEFGPPLGYPLPERPGTAIRLAAQLRYRVHPAQGGRLSHRAKSNQNKVTRFERNLTGTAVSHIADVCGSRFAIVFANSDISDASTCLKYHATIVEPFP